MPPPRYPDELPLIVQLLTVSVEGAKSFGVKMQIPPPPVALLPIAVLPLMTQLLSVTASLSLLTSSSSQKMPPPELCCAEGKPLLIVSPSIVTVCCRIGKMRKVGVPPAVLLFTVNWLGPGPVMVR